jgi:hypothetical protein
LTIVNAELKESNGVGRIRIGSADGYLDLLLQSVKQSLLGDGFDSFTLPNQSIPFRFV